MTVSVRLLKRLMPYHTWLLLAAAPTALLVFSSCTWWDAPIARTVKVWLTSGSQSIAHVPRLPDLLLPLVVCVTLGAWVMRFLLSGNRLRRCLTALGIVAPLSYLSKDVAKFVFGRIETRVWIRHPRAMDFHWLQGTGIYDGFPSGHMLVLTAIIAVFWRYYPLSRSLGSILLLALAAALLLLDYHFLSDVIAGAYMGLLLEWGVASIDRPLSRIL